VSITITILQWIFAFIGISIIAFLSGLAYFQFRESWLDKQRRYYSKEQNYNIGRAVKNISYHFSSNKETMVTLEMLGQKIMDNGEYLSGNYLREEVEKEMNKGTEQ